jgi:hypothetical protein
VSYLQRPGPKSTKLAVPPEVLEERKNNFYLKNKVSIERTISEVHFRVEALRQMIIRMFDEMYARRTGLGWVLQNPDSIFSVYLQHNPLISQYIPPEPRDNVTDTKTRPGRSVNRDCVVDIKKISDLPKFMQKTETFSITIFNFKENEIHLKKEITELTNMFGIWVSISKFFYNHPHWLAPHYDDIAGVYYKFKHDFLLNTRSMELEEKLKVISKFRNLIDNQLTSEQPWYWNGAESLDTLKAYMKSFYHGFYPDPPKFENKPYHDELK